MTTEVGGGHKRFILRHLLDKILSTLVVALLAALVAVVLWQIASRYLIGTPSSFTDELSRFLLIWLGLMGAAYVTGQRLHLAIDLLVTRQQRKNQVVFKRIIHLLVTAFAGSVMVYGGYALVSLTLGLGQTSAALRIPLGYVYVAIPLSGLLICVYSLLNMLNPRINLIEKDHINR